MSNALLAGSKFFVTKCPCGPGGGSTPPPRASCKPRGKCSKMWQQGFPPIRADGPQTPFKIIRDYLCYQKIAQFAFLKGKHTQNGHLEHPKMPLNSQTKMVPPTPARARGGHWPFRLGRFNWNLVDNQRFQGNDQDVCHLGQDAQGPNTCRSRAHVIHLQREGAKNAMRS